MSAVGNQLIRNIRRTGIHRRKGINRMTEIDPAPPRGQDWWHTVYGPMDPMAAQYLAVTWRRAQHGQLCPYYTIATGTPYDCDCWHRGQAIVAASLLRDAHRDGRWENGHV